MYFYFKMLHPTFSSDTSAEKYPADLQMTFKEQFLLLLPITNRMSGPKWQPNESLRFNSS